jgi:hypothetical protein
MEIKVQVEKVRHKTESKNGSFFIVLNTSGGCCTGFIRWVPEIGERVTLSGEYEVYRGERQFKFKSASPDIPADPYAKLRYLAEMANGIGDAMVAAIWEKWGADWETKAAPDAVKGLAGQRWEAFTAARRKMLENAGQVAVVSWCLSKGMTMNQADRAWEAWKMDTMGIVSADPYKISDLPQYGYTDADKVARQGFGMGDHDVRRIRAACRYCLQKLCDDGSTVASWGALLSAALAMLGAIYEDEIIDACADLLRSGSFVGFESDGMIATAELHRAENLILQFTMLSAEGDMRNELEQ